MWRDRLGCVEEDRKRDARATLFQPKPSCFCPCSLNRPARMRKTKIICTLGPATDQPETLAAMIAAGADIFRLNMSHASHDWVREVVDRIRSAAENSPRPIGILLDTQGPAIRTGDLKTDLKLQPGDIVEFTVRGAKSEEKYSVDVNYAGLVEDISVGDTVLVDNGMMRFEVLEKHRNRVRCRVMTPGTLGSRRHINLPGVRVNLPPLTKKDIADVTLGADLGVDYVALSFVREASDIEELRALLIEKRSRACIIAKIEDQSAVRSLDEIIKAADAIMVARGDLGIECPMEELPIIQRRIVKMSIRLGKPVVVATHMLESMISNPLPTRAEITDVANAVFEQADAIMLSGETSVGRYPVDCVQILNRVALRIERSGGAGYGKSAVLEDERQKTVASAVVLANSLRRAKLIVFTRHGTMGRNVSNLRPEHAPVFAFAPTDEVCRQLAICWGLLAIRIDFTEDPNASIEAAEKYLHENNLAKPGDQLVIISDILAEGSRFDCVQLRTAK
jgi:pyruvate kinase